MSEIAVYTIPTGMKPHAGWPTRVVSEDDYTALRLRCESAEGALKEAIEEVESWASYADEYFQKKWDLAGSLARLRAHFHQYGEGSNNGG